VAPNSQQLLLLAVAHCLERAFWLLHSRLIQWNLLDKSRASHWNVPMECSNGMFQWNVLMESMSLESPVAGDPVGIFGLCCSCCCSCWTSIGVSCFRASLMAPSSAWLSQHPLVLEAGTQLYLTPGSLSFSLRCGSDEVTRGTVFSVLLHKKVNCWDVLELFDLIACVFAFLLIELYAWLHFPFWGSFLGGGGPKGGGKSNVLGIPLFLLLFLVFLLFRKCQKEQQT